jgi:hypothetical protein
LLEVAGPIHGARDMQHCYLNATSATLKTVDLQGFREWAILGSKEKIGVI